MTPYAHIDDITATGPGWLAAQRRSAFERASASEYPLGREERWRYTDVSLLHADRFAGLAEPTRRVPRAAYDHWARWNRGGSQAALVNGAPLVLSLPLPAARSGVVLVGLDVAAERHADLLKEHLGALVGPDDVFTAQSLALHRGGLLIVVPEGARLAEPLRLFQWLDAAGTVQSSRIVVVVGAGARVTLDEQVAGGELEAPSLTLPVVELYAGPDSRVTWRSWQQLGAGTRHLSHVAARLDRGASLTTFQATFGGDFSRTNVSVRHAGEGATSELLGVYFPTGEQQQEHWTTQDLAAPHGRSELLHKGALGGRGHSIYYGTIQVGKGARGADAYQTNRNLLLSREARADSNPQLEIDTNDVRCSHGASVSQVDEGQLFYAMSRGIGRAEAQRLVVTGFLAEVAQRLGDPDATDRLARLVGDKLLETP